MRNKDNDEAASEFLDENDLQLTDDEEYLHSIQVCIRKFLKKCLMKKNLFLRIDLH